MRNRRNSHALFLLLALAGCGIFTGNPEDPSYSPDGVAPPKESAFLGPTDEYLAAQEAKTDEQTDCGYFTGQSLLEELEAGRDCIRAAFAESRQAFYLYDETKSDGTRFASFVRIGDAQAVTVHAVSSDPARFVGDETKSCTALSEPIEMSCGVGD